MQLIWGLNVNGLWGKKNHIIFNDTNYYVFVLCFDEVPDQILLEGNEWGNNFPGMAS